MPAEELLEKRKKKKEEKKEKERKKDPDALAPFFCKEYGLVCAEVHFCQDALGFHGAPDERDHTET